MLNGWKPFLELNYLHIIAKYGADLEDLINSTNVWTASIRHRVKRKRSTKRIKHTLKHSLCLERIYS